YRKRPVHQRREREAAPEHHFRLNVESARRARRGLGELFVRNRKSCRIPKKRDLLAARPGNFPHRTTSTIGQKPVFAERNRIFPWKFPHQRRHGGYFSELCRRCFPHPFFWR